MTLLQRIILPALTFPAPDVMYVRLHNDHAFVQRETGVLHFSRWAHFSFDTYFNSMTTGLWKQHCPIENLTLQLTGKGWIIIRIGFHCLGGDSLVLNEKEVCLSSDEPVSIPVSNWPELGNGMLFMAITALEDGELHGGGWYTTSQPQRPVRMAVVVTHYNRQASLTKHLQRLQTEINAIPLADVQLFVVDNSSNLDSDKLPGICIIGNRNLGGSGGFARGLMEAEARGFSHCLFMDDDAACETESIYRIYQLQAFSQRNDSAVAGALLRDIEPFRLYEKGACFDGLCRPLKQGLDMRKIRDLLAAEQIKKTPDYGGWWLFAFPIARVTHYPFPFFVRGDDILFCFQNDFTTISVNGIGSWGGDFSYKNGPLQRYLDTRNHLLHLLSHLRVKRTRALSVLARFFFESVFSHCYTSAHAVTLAIRDVCHGRDFWLQNMDCSAIRAHLANMDPSEKLVPVHQLAEKYENGPPMEESVSRKLFRLATLNGFLLPNKMLKPATVYQPKSFRGTLRQVFRYRRVLYVYEPTGEGMVVSYDRNRFFRELWLFAKATFMFLLHYRRLQREYDKILEELTTRTFWDHVYADKPASPLGDEDRDD